MFEREYGCRDQGLCLLFFDEDRLNVTLGQSFGPGRPRLDLPRLQVTLGPFVHPPTSGWS